MRNEFSTLTAFARQATVGALAGSMAQAFVLLALSLSVAAANETIVTNADRNLLIRVLDARADGTATRILYYTWPNINQAHAAEECSANFYVVELRAGLPATQPQLLAEDYCRHFGMTGALLADGSVLIIAGDRVETWRLGSGQTSAWRLRDAPTLQGIWNQISDGTTPLDIAPNGDIVIAKTLARQRNDAESPSGVIVAFQSDGTLRWRHTLEDPGILLGVIDVWALADGGALLHTTATALAGGALPGTQAGPGTMTMSQNRLYRISAAGALSPPTVIESLQTIDASAAPPPLTEADASLEALQARLQAAFAQIENQDGGGAYGIGDVVAHGRDDGGVDLLLGHRSQEARYLQLDRAGQVVLDTSLSAAMEAQGLASWFDFAVSGDRLMLFGAQGTRRDRLPQGYLSWIRLNDGQAETRLVPLNPLGLEAAKAARDAEMQFLEHNPAQTPVLLTTLAGNPLTVSEIYRARRPALQFDEGNDQLALFTDAQDARAAEAARNAQRAQRQATREALQQAFGSGGASIEALQQAAPQAAPTPR